MVATTFIMCSSMFHYDHTCFDMFRSSTPGMLGLNRLPVLHQVKRRCSCSSEWCTVCGWEWAAVPSLPLWSSKSGLHRRKGI